MDDHGIWIRYLPWKQVGSPPAPKHVVRTPIPAEDGSPPATASARPGRRSDTTSSHRTPAVAPHNAAALPRQFVLVYDSTVIADPNHDMPGGISEGVHPLDPTSSILLRA